MTKETINFKSQAVVDGEEEKIAYEVIAESYQYDDLKVIAYDEPSLDDEKCFTKISYTENEVIVERQATYQSKMVFSKTDKSYGIYELASSKMNFEIELIKLEVNDKEIILQYHLVLGNDNLFNIEIKRK